MTPLWRGDDGQDKILRELQGLQHDVVLMRQSQHELHEQLVRIDTRMEARFDQLDARLTELRDAIGKPPAP